MCLQGAQPGTAQADQFRHKLDTVRSEPAQQVQAEQALQVQTVTEEPSTDTVLGQLNTATTSGSGQLPVSPSSMHKAFQVCSSTVSNKVPCLPE